MPLPFLFTSSDGNVGGGQYSRFKGAVLAGNFTATTSAGTLAEGVAGVGLVQPGTVVSSLGPRAQVVSTAAAAVSAANYVYITQTTGPVSTTSFAAGESAPPLSGMGAALIWDAARFKLGVFSTVHNSWLFSSAAFTSS